MTQTGTTVGSGVADARGVYQGRTELGVVAPEQQATPVATPDTFMQQATSYIASEGADIVKMSQEAKVTQSISQASLDLNALDQKIKVDYQADPDAGVTELTNQRKTMLDGYKDDISPMFRYLWNDKARTLSNASDLNAQSWKIKQSSDNILANVNSTIKNDVSMATMSGENYGTKPDADLQTMLTFATSKQNLTDFATQNLGSQTSARLLQDYNSDWGKSFVSGVAQTNPVKALQMMDDPKIKDMIGNESQFNALKTAVENKALNVQTANDKKQVLDVLKNENSILAQSVDKPMGYGELQQAMAQSGVSDEAASYFMKLNGFAKEDARAHTPVVTSNAGSSSVITNSDTASSTDNSSVNDTSATSATVLPKSIKLSNDEKVQNKAALYEQVGAFSNNADATVDDMRALQSSVYKSLDNGSITKTDGVKILNQIVTPQAQRMEKSLSQFDAFSLGTNPGFGHIQDYFSSNLEIKPGSNGKLTNDQISANANNKVGLYESYMDALKSEADKLGTTVADIPEMSRSDRTPILERAYTAAVQNYTTSKVPQLGLIPEAQRPAMALTTSGELLHGAGDGNPVGNVKVPDNNYRMATTKDGQRVRVYSDGHKEFVQ